MNCYPEYVKIEDLCSSEEAITEEVRVNLWQVLVFSLFFCTDGASLHPLLTLHHPCPLINAKPHHAN